jgi:hypothetical protein
MPSRHPSHRRARLGGLSLAIAAIAANVATAAGPGPVRRAPPPPAEWDKAAAGIFFDNAFTELTGPRPDFPAVVQPAVVPAPVGPGAGQPEPDRDGFTWSSLVSGDTLTDEIKEMKDRVAATVTTPSTFKGGGYQEAQKAFSMLALSFGLIAAHDEDIRWRKDAATARDLFARAGFNCKVGTDQSYRESQLRVEDLAAMLDGNPPQGVANPNGNFLWSQVSGRPPLMTRLEAAEKTVAASTASAGEFTKQLAAVLHEAELVAAIGQVIQQPDFEDHDDESYAGYAAAMRDAAVRLRDACLQKDHTAAAAAAAAISKSCNDCHGDYR